MRRSNLIIAAMVAFVVALGGTTPAASVKEVTFSLMAVTPAEVVIQPGDMVNWVNNDPMEHAVVSGTGPKMGGVPDGKFYSGIIAPGKSWERRFTEPGEYPYFCPVHVYMKGRVIVRR